MMKRKHLSSAHLPNAELLMAQMFIEHPLLAGSCARPAGGGSGQEVVPAYRGPAVEVERECVRAGIPQPQEGDLNLDQENGDCYTAGL